jgi:hypothetical protein
VIALGGGQDTEIDQPATVDDLVVATVVDRWASSPWIADLFTWHRTAALWGTLARVQTLRAQWYPYMPKEPLQEVAAYLALQRSGSCVQNVPDTNHDRQWR